MHALSCVSLFIFGTISTEKTAPVTRRIGGKH